MLCEIARGLEAPQLEQIRRLEDDLGLAVVAFACRSLDPAREERLRTIQEDLGPMLAAEPAAASQKQLARIRELESAMGLSLVAVRLGQDDGQVAH